ncbi:MAG TPA: thiamine phosphate synthase [Terriglobia bacterium]|nr:thiamine phosphate synthase [Terriglobia bacterium]
MRPAPWLCYITDRHSLGSRPVLGTIAEAIRAGVDLVQIREKDLATRPLAELVQASVELGRRLSGESGLAGLDCPARTARLIVNDRFDVALACGAAGVHLGTRSIPAAEVRAAAPPGFLVGVSCHSLEDALAAERARADYILLGPVFETLSKLRYGPPLGLTKLAEVTTRVCIPVLALGSVKVERVRACLEAGAAGIAGISIFQDCESLVVRVAELRAAAIWK